MEMVMNELDPREEPGSEEELVAGCAMLDSCAEIRTPDSLYNVLTHNFIRFFYQPSSISLIDYNNLEHRHYEQNRAPLGLYLHAAWFVREPEMMDALLFWLDEVLRTYGDTVYVVTMSQVLLITHPGARTRVLLTDCAGAGLDAEAHPRLPGGHLPALVRPLHRPRHAPHLPGE